MSGLLQFHDVNQVKKAGLTCKTRINLVHMWKVTAKSAALIYLTLHM